MIETLVGPEVDHYESQLELRDGVVDNMLTWMWPKHDDGAYGVENGPMMDWIVSHREAYLKHVRKFDVVVQAGGNCGMYPRLFSDIFKIVYTFEPDPLNFYTLCRNCQKDNIIKLQAALGDAHKMISIRERMHNNVGMHIVEEKSDSLIPQLCIDDLDLHACDLIQLDVEGYEQFVLKGAESTIMKHRPVIALETPSSDLKSYMEDHLKYQPVEKTQMDVVFIPV